MIFSRGSLILGGLVMAVGAQDGGVLDGQPTVVPPTTATASSIANTPSSTFLSNWTIPTPIPLGTPMTYTFLMSPWPEQVSFDLQLVLCQTNASASTLVDSTNSWSVSPLQTCSEVGICSPGFTSNLTTTTVYNFLASPGSPTDPAAYKNFFFCFGTIPSALDSLTCESYSQFFDMEAPNVANAQSILPTPTSHTPRHPTGSNQVTARQGDQTLVRPLEVLPISNVNPIVSYVGGPTVPASATPTTTSTSFMSISVSIASSTSSGPIAVSSTPSPSRSSGGLSTGAKVGIALGALFLAAILLLVALFFLRRKHSRRSQPEQVMLTRDMHADSFSRNLIAEKEELNSSPLSGPSPIDHSLPIQRHSALSPYEPLPSAPYSGAAATAPSAIPRRKPTAATMASTVSRGISNASTGSVLSPRSATTAAGAAGHEFEEYHDVPIYGDARHVPQLNTFSGASHSQAPFLGEEGMTAEEAARLEEEERRIDAAIEAAERERGNR